MSWVDETTRVAAMGSVVAAVFAKLADLDAGPFSVSTFSTAGGDFTVDLGCRADVFHRVADVFGLGATQLREGYGNAHREGRFAGAKVTAYCSAETLAGLDVNA